MLIGDAAVAGVEAAISVASLAELHLGVLVARTPEERARRLGRLTAVESAFDALPVTPEVARRWGMLAAAVAERGGNPRRRSMDLAIAATALVEGVPLITLDASDMRIISDLLEVRAP